VESLATAVGMSRASFAEQFRRLVGETPLQYLTRWRMQRAAELLSDEGLPLAAVAHRVGYSAESAFSKVFKKFVGEAPGRYRRRFHGPGSTGRAAAQAPL
jgi:AraC-like DNA-binding protein